MTARLTLVHALSPLHAGTGQSVGAIDLPVARERPTGIPLVPASSIKGALRARSSDPQLTRDIFGPETTSASDHAGSVQFSDVHVVLFPVRSVAGTYAWVTSRYLLQRFARTALEAGIALPPLPQATRDDRYLHDRAIRSDDQRPGPAESGARRSRLRTDHRGRRASGTPRRLSVLRSDRRSFPQGSTTSRSGGRRCSPESAWSTTTSCRSSSTMPPR